MKRVRATLETGDYSIDGYQGRVTVERKSVEDLVQTLAKGRKRFEREHERMAAMGTGNAVVMVEAAWQDVFDNIVKSQMHPKTIHRTALSWFVRYGIPWLFCGTRRAAEISAFRYLQQWWRHNA